MSSHKSHSDMVNGPKAGKEIASYLNSVLANEYSLFTKTLNYHWNITGPRFQIIHNFLGENYNELLLMMDEVAERVRMLDERPVSTIKGMVSNMEIKDAKESSPSAESMLENLLMDHLTIQSQIKEIVSDNKKFSDDPGTADLLVGILRKHEMMSWKFRSQLTKS
jgi:starvation-inducible DNA-binding protein